VRRINGKSLEYARVVHLTKFWVEKVKLDNLITAFVEVKAILEAC
jgi:hypothetical protein